MSSSWQPSATLDTLIERASLIKQVRAFFDARGVIEVETPLLSHATVTDPHLEGFPVQVGNETGYLQTSPEYAMKRLLAAGMPSIYQLGKVFRVDEVGRFHNPEFTMLEWYRLGFDLYQLMDEVDDLCQLLIGCPKATRMTYAQVFSSLGMDPLTADVATCQAVAKAHGVDVSESLLSAPKDTWLQLLFATLIEPTLGFDGPAFITHYPASQASLSRLDPADPRVALRVEVFIDGVEIGNGYDELQDPALQQARFEEDNRIRATLGLAQKPVDPYLLAALQHGFPHCSGIAIGMDRLLMCALKKPRIQEVLCFDWPRA
ncbi:MAG: EF-P lysine aminoacylase EpmA [Gammaproteobacteria bacterium]